MASARTPPPVKNGREPDWGRFGLNEERQPLNPSGTTTDVGREGGSALGTENKELLGGQAQNKNELFAQDQVCTNVYYI